MRKAVSGIIFAAAAVLSAWTVFADNRTIVSGTITDVLSSETKIIIATGKGELGLTVNEKTEIIKDNQPFTWKELCRMVDNHPGMAANAVITADSRVIQMILSFASEEKNQKDEIPESDIKIEPGSLIKGELLMFPEDGKKIVVQDKKNRKIAVDVRPETIIERYAGEKKAERITPDELRELSDLAVVDVSLTARASEGKVFAGQITVIQRTVDISGALIMLSNREVLVRVAISPRVYEEKSIKIIPGMTEAFLHGNKAKISDLQNVVTGGNNSSASVTCVTERHKKLIALAIRVY